MAAARGGARGGAMSSERRRRRRQRQQRRRPRTPTQLRAVTRVSLEVLTVGDEAWGLRNTNADRSVNRNSRGFQMIAAPCSGVGDCLKSKFNGSLASSTSQHGVRTAREDSSEELPPVVIVRPFACRNMMPTRQAALRSPALRCEAVLAAWSSRAASSQASSSTGADKDAAAAARPDTDAAAASGSAAAAAGGAPPAHPLLQRILRTDLAAEVCHERAWLHFVSKSLAIA